MVEASIVYPIIILVSMALIFCLIWTYILSCAVLVMLMDLQKISAWSVIIIIMREFGIMGFRIIIYSFGIAPPTIEFLNS